MTIALRGTSMERQVRNQARGLLWVSILLLFACASMTSMFGWSMGRTLLDKVVYAIGLVAADLGGAYLMATSGTCSANRETRAAGWAMFAAIICCALTLSGIVGFQAENREGSVHSRERAIKLADSQIEWFKSLTTENAQGKGKASLPNTSAMALGFEAVGKAVKDQIERLQSGEISSTIDGQATTIARITGASEEKVRSWMTTLTAGALLFIQYSCLWFYGFLRHRIEPAVGALAHGPLGPRPPVKSGQLRDNVEKTTFEQARQDVETNINAGIELCNRQYADRWGVSESKACKWAKQLVRDGIAEQQWRGQRKVLVRCRKGLRVLYGGAVATAPSQ
jgi:hypothetical protein